MIIDRGELVKKINYWLIESTWKIVEVSIYKTYTNLTDTFDQLALASQLIVISTNVSISFKYGIGSSN